MEEVQATAGNEEDGDRFEANKATVEGMQQQYLAHPSSELLGQIQQLYEQNFNLFQYYGYDRASFLDSSCAPSMANSEAETEEASKVSSESSEHTDVKPCGDEVSESDTSDKQQCILMTGESSRFSEPKPKEIGTGNLNERVEAVVTLGDLMGDDYDFSADELKNLKNRIPSPKEKEVYKQPKFSQKRSYHCQRISGTAGSFRAGIDAPVLSVVQDERTNSKPIDAIIGGVRSNLAGRIVAFNLLPNFSVSMTDRNIDYALRLRVELKGVARASGRKPVAIFLESLTALSSLATFPVKKKIDRGIVEVIKLVPGQPITTRLESVKDLKIDPRWQILLQETWTRPEAPELELYAARNRLTFRNRRPLTASPTESTSQQVDVGETSSQPREVQEQRIVRYPIPSHEEDKSSPTFDIKTAEVGRMYPKNITYNYLYISVEISLPEYQNYTLHAVFDTGATISAIRPEAIPKEYWLEMKRKTYINGVQGYFELTHKVTNFPLLIEDIDGQPHQIVIKEMLIFPGMNGDIIIGNNVLQHFFPIKIDKSIVSITNDGRKIKVPRVQGHKHICGNPHFTLKRKALQASMEIFADHLDENHKTGEKMSSTSQLLTTRARKQKDKDIATKTRCNISLTFILNLFYSFVAMAIIPVCSYFWCRKSCGQ